MPPPPCVEAPVQGSQLAPVTRHLEKTSTHSFTQCMPPLLAAMVEIWKLMLSMKPQGSTIADVIASPLNFVQNDTSDASSIASFVEPRPLGRTEPLTSSSRPLIKIMFS